MPTGHWYSTHCSTIIALVCTRDPTIHETVNLVKLWVISGLTWSWLLVSRIQTTPSKHRLQTHYSTLSPLLPSVIVKRWFLPGAFGSIWKRALSHSWWAKCEWACCKFIVLLIWLLWEAKVECEVYERTNSRYFISWGWKHMLKRYHSLKLIPNWLQNGEKT